MELEKKLRAELKKKSFWDPDVRRLRHTLAQAYAATLFANFTFAQANDVEQQLWKACYYRPIEEFRSRMRAAQQAAAGAANAGATPEEGKAQ
ncbi:uncharacterized protein HaLaN_26277, partial [Haematococcus lacustris]